MSHKHPKSRAQTNWNTHRNENGTRSLRATTAAEIDYQKFTHPVISPRNVAAGLSMSKSLHDRNSFFSPHTHNNSIHISENPHDHSSHFSAFSFAGVETMLTQLNGSKRNVNNDYDHNGPHHNHNTNGDSIDMYHSLSADPILTGNTNNINNNNGIVPSIDTSTFNFNNINNNNNNQSIRHGNTVLQTMKLLSHQQQAHRRRSKTQESIFDIMAASNSNRSLNGNNHTPIINTFNGMSSEIGEEEDLFDDMLPQSGTIRSTRSSKRKSSEQYMFGNTNNIIDKNTIDPNEWEAAIKEIESHGKWIQCRTTLVNRVLWYNTNSFRIVFDRPAELDAYYEEIEKNKTQILSQTKTQVNKMVDTTGRPLKYFVSKDRTIEPKPDEDVVQELLYFKGHAWEFNNDFVDVYRAQASRKNHHKMLPKAEQYCFPEYFSETPIPEMHGGKFLAKIRIPEEFRTNRQYGTIMIKADHTRGADAVKQGVKKIDGTHEDKDFILKVVGQEEYIYGRKKVIDYEAVRNAVRNENDAEFVLINRPDKSKVIREAKLKQQEYAESFKVAYPENIRDKSFLEYEDLKDNEIPKFNSQEIGTQQIISLYELDWPWRIKIEGVTNVTSLPRFNEQIMRNIFVRAEMWMGDMIFDNATLNTSNVEPKSEIRWGEWLMCRNQTFSQIPREAILCFIVYGIDNNNNNHPLAWCRLPLIDHRHKLRKGKILLNMWELPLFRLEKDGPKTDPFKLEPFRYRGTTRDKNIKFVEPEQCQLLLEFDSFAVEVIAPKHAPNPHDTHALAVGGKLKADQLTKSQKNSINIILDRSPLEELKPKEKSLIWSARDLLSHDPKALPAFLRSVNWTNRVHIAEAHKYLDIWRSPKRPEDALEFLDYRFADTRVREKTIKYLSEMSDGQLQKYLLQLVQCLKYEPHHDSALARFLIRRGLKNPYQIGHFLFWHLKAEYHTLEYCERFGVIMEEYLKHAGEHSRQLFIQSMVLKRLEFIAEKIFKAKHSQPSEICKKLLKKELNRLNRDLPESIQIPLNPRWRAKKLIVDKCRYMGSKKVPLWLVFENSDEYASPIEILFKSGDDLRQDMLTLQMLNVMDSVWLDSKLDLHLKPYTAIATGINSKGEGVGMLEIVLNSTTINSVNVKYGGAFNAQTINQYLIEQQCNKGTAINKARDTFARSCAGYCVATFVMGIGDRHSDNIMVSRAGHFFHIDFGHFLGNFKSKFGVRRERSPFVFTPQMKYAINAGEKKSPLYDSFFEWCHEAYNVLRSRARLFLVLFALMVSAGMPELMMESDILYFQDKLNLHYDIKKARDHLKSLIKNSLKDRARLIDNAIHAAVHGGSSKKKNDKYDSKSLLEACRYGQSDRVKKCLEAGANVNETDDNGFTPLIYASNAGHIKIVDILMKRSHKLNINYQGVRNCDGMTALIAAAKSNHKTLGKLLLTNKDIDTNIQDIRGFSALHYASQNGNLSFARHLMNHNGKRQMTNKEGKTPIDIAKSLHNNEMLQLLENGPTIK